MIKKTEKQKQIRLEQNWETIRRKRTEKAQGQSRLEKLWKKCEEKITRMEDEKESKLQKLRETWGRKLSQETEDERETTTRISRLRHHTNHILTLIWYEFSCQHTLQNSQLNVIFKLKKKAVAHCFH
jgi:hypothetical protein